MLNKNTGRTSSVFEEPNLPLNKDQNNWDLSKFWYWDELKSRITTLIQNARISRESVSPSISSGKSDKSKTIRDSRGIFNGIVPATDGTNSIRIRVFDGIKKRVLPTLTITGLDNFEPFFIPVKLDTNCTVKIQGSGGKYAVEHSDRIYG